MINKNSRLYRRMCRVFVDKDKERQLIASRINQIGAEECPPGYRKYFWQMAADAVAWRLRHGDEQAAWEFADIHRDREAFNSILDAFGEFRGLEQAEDDYHRAMVIYTERLKTKCNAYSKSCPLNFSSVQNFGGEKF